MAPGAAEAWWRPLPGPWRERDQLFARVVAEAPGYADHQAKTERRIPVVVLHRIGAGSGPDEEPVKGMGDWVVEVHDWLREELRTLRAWAERLTEAGDGGGAEPAGPAGGTPSDLAQQMRAHCLTFCGALARHHGGEDVATFPMPAGRFPALAPALAQLGEEHTVVARTQDAIQELVGTFVPGVSDPGPLRAELERLAARLESHFRYEEETIVTALNALARAPESG
jgi:hypothetical protein